MKAKMIKEILQRAEGWPESAQADLAQAALEIERELQEDTYTATPEEVAAIPSPGGEGAAEGGGWGEACQSHLSAHDFPRPSASGGSPRFLVEDYLPLARRPISISPRPVLSAVCRRAISSSARRYSTGITFTNFGR